jgi:GR25 family glycosyltransferase involved in LPS biosynthesis
MDSSKERLNTIMDAAKAAKIELVRFPAIVLHDDVLKNNRGQELQEQGVGSLLYYSYDTKGLVKRGTIGCYLSHRGVMRKIAEDTNDKSKGTLILEDDANVPPNLIEKVNAAIVDLPEDWDILYIGRWQTESQHIKNSVHKITNRFNPDKNWGMWAYFVKNTSVKDKILPCLDIMFNNLDLQLNYYVNKLNTYLIVPNIVDYCNGVKSDLNTHNAN